MPVVHLHISVSGENHFFSAATPSAVVALFKEMRTMNRIISKSQLTIRSLTCLLYSIQSRSMGCVAVPRCCSNWWYALFLAHGVYICFRIFFLLSRFFIATHMQSHLQHRYFSNKNRGKAMTFAICARCYSTRYQITKHHEIHLTNVFILMCLCQSLDVVTVRFLSLVVLRLALTDCIGLFILR